MAPARRSLGNVATPSPLVPAGERKPRRSFFTSLTKLPLVLPQATSSTSPAPKPSMISLAEFAPPPDFVQSALLPPTTSPVQDVPQASTSGPRIKEVVSFRVSRRSAAAAEATVQEKIRSEERESSSSAADVVAAQPRASRSSTRRDSQRLSTPQEVVTIPSSPSPAPVDEPVATQAENNLVATQPSRTKDFLQAGLYCQDADASPSPLITDLLAKKSKGRGKAKSHATSTFPPLPIEHGVVTFLNRQNDFVLPYNIVRDFENGRLGAKKVPEKYTKLRGSQYSLSSDVRLLMLQMSSLSDKGGPRQKSPYVIASHCQSAEFSASTKQCPTSAAKTVHLVTRAPTKASPSVKERRQKWHTSVQSIRCLPG